jgi:predicted nucleotidyltransferase
MSEAINAIFSKSGLRLLQIFLYKPRHEMHQADVIKATGLSRMTVMKLLKAFREAGILRCYKKGDLSLYFIDEANPVAKQVKILLNVSAIYERFKDLQSEDVEIYLFGSAARGDDHENSDIDLLVITDKQKEAVLDRIEEFAREYGREINPVVYTFMQFSLLPKTDKAFYNSIEKDMIRLV